MGLQTGIFLFLTNATPALVDNTQEDLWVVDNKTTTGHPPGFLLRHKKNEVKKLTADGSLIGIFPASYSNFGEKKIQLEPGDKIFLYTDAIIEAFNKKGEMLDLKYLQVMLQEHIHLPIDQLLEEAYQHGLEFSGEPSYDDDATLVGFEVLE